jgi:hypothetical protein
MQSFVQIDRKLVKQAISSFWIPAFAGMTVSIIMIVTAVQSGIQIEF